MRTQTIAISGLAAFLMLGGLALTGTGCAGSQYKRSTGAYLDDKGISTRVKTALFRDPMVSGFDVHVDTFRGDVQLNGFVDTPEQKERAAQIAREVSGVGLVTNNLEVKPTNPVNAAMGTAGGTVQYGSRTSTQAIPEQPAVDTTKHLAPVRSSSNDTISNQSSSSAVGSSTTLETSSNSGANGNAGSTVAAPIPLPQRTSALAAPRNLEINANNGQATIRGTVDSETERSDIERRVRDIPGIQNVQNELKVLSAPTP